MCPQRPTTGSAARPGGTWPPWASWAANRRPAAPTWCKALRSAGLHHALTIDLRLPDRLPIAGPVAEATVRAVGELLTNVERHAGVFAARIELVAVGSGFALSITDTGLGFDPHRRGRGLNESVIARMNRVGGVVDIRSAADAGTIVELRWQPT